MVLAIWGREEGEEGRGKARKNGQARRFVCWSMSWVTDGATALRLGLRGVDCGYRTECAGDATITGQDWLSEVVVDRHQPRAADRSSRSGMHIVSLHLLGIRLLSGLAVQ